MNDLSEATRSQIALRGLSAVLDELLHREQLSRSELLYWKQQRQLVEAEIRRPIDELSEIAEAAFNVSD